MLVGRTVHLSHSVPECPMEEVLHISPDGFRNETLIDARERFSISQADILKYSQQALTEDLPIICEKLGFQQLDEMLASLCDETAQEAKTEVSQAIMLTTTRSDLSRRPSSRDDREQTTPTSEYAATHSSSSRSSSSDVTPSMVRERTKIMRGVAAEVLSEHESNPDHGGPAQGPRVTTL